MKKLALFIFGIAVAGVLLADILEVAWLFTMTKPLIMASLLFFYSVSSGPEHRSNVLVVAIVFSLAGDVLLMKEEYFVLGLVAFLLSHLFYIFTYRQFVNEESDNALNGLQRVRLAFPIILAGSGLVVILFPVLGDLKIFNTALRLSAVKCIERHFHFPHGVFFYAIISHMIYLSGAKIVTPPQPASFEPYPFVEMVSFLLIQCL